MSLVCFRATVGEFAVLLFLGTSPCSPSARLSACCRNQSFPENREKHHQAISYFELSPKAMIGKSSLSMIGKSYHHLIQKSMHPTPRIQLPVRPFVREIIE